MTVKCVKCDTTLDGDNLRSWQEWSCGSDECVPKCIPCLATDKVTVCHVCESVSKYADINICETCDKPYCENCNSEDGDNCAKCNCCKAANSDDDRFNCGYCDKVVCSKCEAFDCFVCEGHFCDTGDCKGKMISDPKAKFVSCASCYTEAVSALKKSKNKTFVLWSLNSEDLADVLARQPTEDECKEVKDCFEKSGLEWHEHMRIAVEHCGIPGPDCVTCGTSLEGFCDGDDLEDFKMRR